MTPWRRYRRGECCVRRLAWHSLPLALPDSLPDAAVHCTYLDLYRANLALDYWRDGPPNLRIECAVDLAVGEADVVAFPFSAGGEAELTRDLLQSGHERLALGGKLFAATDNADDTWLGDELRKIFRKLERRPSSTGVLYVAHQDRAAQETQKLRLRVCVSRPRPADPRLQPPGRFLTPAHRSRRPPLDRCNANRSRGTSAGYRLRGRHRRAGRRLPRRRRDRPRRRLKCTGRGMHRARRRHSTASRTSTVELNADGNYQGAGQFDLALANPPYYSGFRIARHFLTAGRQALRPGGTMLLVTKQPEWYQQHMPEWFDELTMTERKGYYLLQAVRPPD